VCFTECYYKLFADDTKLYSILHDSSSCNSLQKSLDSISGWSDHWQLKLSPTSVLLCALRQLILPAVLHPTILFGESACDCECNDLGVSYDSCLNFKSHIDKIVSKASCRAKLILKCLLHAMLMYSCLLFLSL